MWLAYRTHGRRVKRALWGICAGVAGAKAICRGFDRKRASPATVPESAPGVEVGLIARPRCRPTQRAARHASAGGAWSRVRFHHFLVRRTSPLASNR